MAVKKNNNNPRSVAYIWASLRISLGLIFLWAFFDKLFGLGFATCRDAKTDAVSMMCSKAWAEGGSPTLGFLKFGTKGPLAEFYQSLAGNGLVDVLFMSGLLLIGLALVLGIGVRIAAIAGSLLLFMMWTAVLLPENNPILDDHLIYILVLAGIYHANSDQKWGLRNWWVKQPLVKNLPILE
jgi:thiosulfate dehydrogenase [quinone] large subunit